MSRDSRHLVLFIFATAVALYVAWLVRGALLIIYVSSVFAVVLKPGVDWLHSKSILGWRPGRAAALLVLVAFLGVAVGGLAAIAVPSIVSSISQFGASMAAPSRSLQEHLHSVPLLRNLNVARVEEEASARLTRLLPEIGGATTAVLSGLLLTAYLILDGAALLHRSMELFPPAQRPRLESTLQRAGARMRRWLAGQAILMLILGSSAAVTFGLMGLPYFYLLAVFAGLANIVPMLGPLATVLVAGAVAATQSIWHVVGVVVFYLTYQQVESAFLTPNIMKSQVEISSSVVIIALLVGGELAGVAGALVAVPSAVLVGELITEYLLVPTEGERD